MLSTTFALKSSPLLNHRVMAAPSSSATLPPKYVTMTLPASRSSFSSSAGSGGATGSLSMVSNCAIASIGVIVAACSNMRTHSSTRSCCVAGPSLARSGDISSGATVQSA